MEGGGRRRKLYCEISYSSLIKNLNNDNLMINIKIIYILYNKQKKIDKNSLKKILVPVVR